MPSRIAADHATLHGHRFDPMTPENDGTAGRAVCAAEDVDGAAGPSAAVTA